MDLSIVIVNYNVRYFLEQCLLSVGRAIEGMRAEVWVVDNHSADGSVAMVREQFPWVKLIANSDNPGFSVANNQAIRRAQGEFILLLNPDTFVGEDSLRRCLTYTRAHERVGALGVRMIDGSGRFLPESKRGLPTPEVAFAKLSGLSKLFPRHPRWGRYHLSFLPERETHSVDVLAGAFMWLRRSALDEVGLLDEDFWMYGEDIDLSYRIQRAGYDVVYFADVTIVHYKGESTKRGSLNYVRVFYRAMVIFAEKHFAATAPPGYLRFLRTGIYLRGVLTVISNLYTRLRFPLLDAAGMYLGLRVLKPLWANYHFNDPGYFSDALHYLHFPAYTGLWVMSIYLGGGYDRPFDLGRTFRSVLIASLLLLAIYGLLPEYYRPSRALLVLGSVVAVAWVLFVRAVAHYLRYGHFSFSRRGVLRSATVGEPAQIDRVNRLYQTAGVQRVFLGRMPVEAALDKNRLDEFVDRFRVQELVFCLAAIPYAAVVKIMDRYGERLSYQTLPATGSGIIGSRSSSGRGTLYTLASNFRISRPEERRAKWLLDKGIAVGMLMGSPVLYWVWRRRFAYFSSCWAVLAGRKHWVGYASGEETRNVLPPLRPGVFTTTAGLGNVDGETAGRLDYLYARDWGVGEELRVFWRGVGW